ncbi:Beta-galactosidase [Tritrichomonas foetus]|uniref:Beta-galactosidase n=1 Tax=Tritrichomonas foetus TaxID=1144522 RepID=A0A1J4KHM0_9EUKA|nr:Beta-galactosidase [Tritrichomonas foetus]|eukprot:OHT10887.1 Beta-galactosidase [Tritrichomonas foetus]
MFFFKFFTPPLFYVSVCQRSFSVNGNTLLMNEKPFQYVSGEFHYFRQHPDSWEDTLKKMINGGLNVVSTYVAWNIHEPRKGEFNFQGFADIERFIQLVHKYGLYLIFRPGPYICAEWDNGGIPYWVRGSDYQIKLRTSDFIYMKHVTEYFDVLYSKLAKYSYHRGGPIIMVQIENEYGSFHACDKHYLNALCDIAEKYFGKNMLLFTVDGRREYMFQCGTIPNRALATVDFGMTSAEEAFELMRKYNNNECPLINSEFYPGWLDHWGRAHKKVVWYNVTKQLDIILSMKANVNIYMYIGGTNFGFYSGANGDDQIYVADPTSYDYDAPLSEAGDMTYKYYKMRSTIAKYMNVKTIADVKNSTKKSFGEVKFTKFVSLFEFVEMKDKETTLYPIIHEMMNIDYGFSFHRSKNVKNGLFEIPEIHDRAYIYINRKFKGIAERNKGIALNLTQENNYVEILVENMGRINFGNYTKDFKGLINGVFLNHGKIINWENFEVKLNDLNDLQFHDIPENTKEKDENSEDYGFKPPFILQGTFDVDEPADTFLNPTGFTKGVAFINGFNLGRYWTIGPQLTLFVPKGILKNGQNTLTVFEYESTKTDLRKMTLDASPQIDIIEETNQKQVMV